ncbi:mediator of RNA polymerase II transcription subunit 24-like isoform X2 [Gigantopelta aegis]|uniref:mediator of RNA polymerase II transcription subunit 24-like isoform X2 n=1 Tax=Gigantopelta aegis TaxID=1735272 RepID=UPI001B88BD46|nr:mediator of RNA polymerase II transcription subunit 24-like isoform X2 [Gigantopelta aegis]
MEVGHKEVSSLTNQVKLTLMRAWRERWSEVKWGVHLKRIVAGHTGETCDLSEILLQQALVGSSPNTLVLSYLKHAVLSQVIPYSSVFKHISKFEQLTRPYCVLALVDLAEVFATKISFTYSPDSALQLSKSLLLLLHWLLLTTLRCLQKVQEGKQSQEYLAIIENSSTAVLRMLEQQTVCALLQISRSEVVDVYREFEQTELNVRGTLSQLPQNSLPGSVREKVSLTLTSLSQLQESQLSNTPILQVPHLPICPTINGLVALEVVLNPTNEMQPFVDQVLVITRLLKLSWPQLYQEMFRACFMGLVDSTDSQEELKWAAFTFLKMPHILTKMQQLSIGADFRVELERGFDLFLNYIHLLDLTDIKQKYDCVGELLKQCVRFELLAETQKDHLLQRRNAEKENPRLPETSSSSSTTSLIMRAEMTVTSILKTLDADYQKNQDPLVGILNHMLSGRSFEIILAAGASMGELQNFALKLIKINEFARQACGEGGKAAQIRAQLFDVTFLMLCHIIQLYGIEIVSSLKETTDSFIVQWAHRWLPEDGKYKNIENCLPNDPTKVDSLLNQFSSGGELRTNLTRWHDVCLNTPFAIQEVLFAWEHEAINIDNVKMFLDNVKSLMCCLSVVVCVWLCSYMNTVVEKARVKPLAMLEHLTSKFKSDPTVQADSRTHLMTIVIDRIINDILPVNNPQHSTVNVYIPAKSLPSQVLEKTLTQIFNKGWIDLHSLHTVEQLLSLCGSDWFCERVVVQMLQTNDNESLCQALSLVFAMFHMDLEHLTQALLLHTVPRILHARSRQYMLTNPRGYTLAKLCVLCITAAQVAKTGHKEPFIRRGRKRSRKEVELEEQDEADLRPTKVRKVNEPQLTLHSEGYNFEDIAVKEDGEASPSLDTKEPVNKALANLFHLMNAIIHHRSLTPRTGFVISFVEEAVKCGVQYSRHILQFMPHDMLLQIQKTMPGVYSNAQILQICDVTTLSGRNIAAKAVCHNSKAAKR